jgi:fibronectin type 3 domain-containing protein
MKKAIQALTCLGIISLTLSCSQMPSGVLELNPTTSPAGVSATAKSSSSIDVQWTKVSGATSYGIFRSASSGGSFAQTGSAGDTSFLDTGLIANMEYYYKIMASDSVHQIESKFSVEVSAITMTVQPPALISPANETIGQPLIRSLSWAAVTGAVSYHVQVSRDSIFTTIFAEDSTLVSDSITVTGLANSTSYCWRVRTKDPGGVSLWTSSWNFTTIVAAPSVPVLVSPPDSAANQPVSLVLFWNNAARASTYYLQVATDTGFANVANADSTLTDTSKAISGLANNAAYYWRVRAKNDGGTSGWSSVRSFVTIVAAPQTPTLTTPVNGATDQSATPTLTWSTVTGAATYHVQVSTSNTFATILIEDSTLTSVSKALSGFANGTQYYWRVQAKNAGGVSAWTSPWGFTTIIAAPQTPTLTTPADGSTRLSTTPTLTWATVTGAATYHVQVSTVNTFETILIEDSTLTAATKALTGLTNGTQYYWRVQAKNAGGVSAWTSPWGFTTIIAAPSTPTLTSPADGTTGLSLTPTLTWSTVTGAATYHVQVSTVNTFATILVEDSTLTSATKALSGLANGTQYYWRVQAKNAGGVSAWTNPWGFMTIIAEPQIPTLTSPADGTTGLSLTPILTWSTVDGPATYHVQVSTSNTFATVVIEDSTLTSASKALSGLANGTKYYWRVRAKNASGVSAWTSPWGLTTIIAAPQTPTLTAPSNGAIGQMVTPALTWSIVTGAVLYHVQVSTDNTFSTFLIEDSTLTSASKLLNGLANNATYFWRVQAKNAGGVSAWTSIWSFTTIISAPQTPTLTVPANGETGQSIAPTLTWSTVIGAETYRVQVSMVNTFTTNIVDDSTLTSASKSLIGLSKNATYYWRVNAKNVGGVSAWTDAWSFTTIIAAPQTPALASPADGATGQLCTPILTWSAASGAATYHIQVSTDNMFATILAEDSTLTSTSKPLSGLMNSITYYWRVQAKNAGGSSNWTSPWSFTTIIAAPQTPTLNSPINRTIGVSVSPTFAWSTVFSAITYHIQVSTDSTFATVPIQDSTLTSASKYLYGLVTATTYYWRARAKNAGGVSGWSNPWHFTTAIWANVGGIPFTWSSGSALITRVNSLSIGPNGTYLFAATEESGVLRTDADGKTGFGYMFNSGFENPGYATCAESFAVSGNNLFVGVCEGTALVNGGGVFLSTTNGENWTQANSGLGNSSVRSIAISGSNMFAATDGKGIYLSANNGESWAPVDSGLPDTTHTWVQSLAVKGGNIFAGTAGGGVFLSTNNGTSWTAVNSGLTGKGLYVSSLAVSGGNIFAGTAGGGVFLSTNNGTSWTAVNSGLMDTTVWSLAINGNDVFAGTAFNSGVYISTNNGTSWTSISSGLPTNNGITSIIVSGTNLFAGTTASGVFRASLP